MPALAQARSGVIQHASDCCRLVLNNRRLCCLYQRSRYQRPTTSKMPFTPGHGNGAGKSTSISLRADTLLDFVSLLPTGDKTYHAGITGQQMPGRMARHRSARSGPVLSTENIFITKVTISSPAAPITTAKLSSSRVPLLLRQLIAPRWLRSFRGLLLLIGMLVGVVIVASREDPAIKLAKVEAQLAEKTLGDVDFDDFYSYEDDLTNLRNQTGNAKSPTTLWPFSKATEEETTTNKGHALHPNGLLIADPDAERHPIFELIARGDREWKALNAKQSRTLKGAAAEYRRRYKRHPPKGFEKWWHYVQSNKVNFPDEYNQIDRDLAPFRAIEPNDLRHRAKAMQERGHTFTLVFRKGEVSVEGPFAHLRRATDIRDLVSRFSRDLPHDLNMTFIMDDSPAILLQHETKSRMVELGEQEEYFGPSDFMSDQGDVEISNYARACPPTSLLRQQERDGANRPSNLNQSEKSFIYNPSKANDVCDHPEFRQLHGHTVTPGTGLTPLTPLFAWAKMPTHSDILVTPLEQYWDAYDGYDPNWSDKTENRLLWRGSTTGADFSVNSPWRDSQRARLHFNSREMNGTRDLLWSDEDGTPRVETFDNADLNAAYMDTSFSGQPAQCDAETCEIMRKEIDFAGLQGLDDSYQYKYMIDVDGNAWSGRFHRLMSTKSLVLKSTVFPEWYADRIIPWYHYVPVKVDYTDLYDILGFFIGTPDGRGSHDMLAHKLAQNGKDWAKRNWRRADMASYMFRLVLEYSRLLNQDDNSDYID